jgi:hypothetical protein
VKTSLLLAFLLAACGGSQRARPIANTAAGGSPGGAGKGSARVDQRTVSGGVISLIGERDVAMEAANKEMAAHCGEGSYMIVQEGEEMIDDSAIGAKIKTEWRVHYQCTTSGALPPPSP